MKQGFDWRKRSVAAALALAMLFSCAHFAGVPRAQAAKDTYTVTGSELIAENYSALTAAERELLVLLGGGESFTYDVPDKSDALVSVDPDAATVTAKDYTSQGVTWKATAAELHDAEGNTVEQLKLTGGKAGYSYTGTAFTVHVTYTLNVELDMDDQEALLEQMRGVAAMKKAADSALSAMDDLDMIATSMEVLVKLRAGLTYSIAPGVNAKIQLGADAQAAVDVLHAQYKANGKKLELQSLLSAYSEEPMTYLAGQGSELVQAMRTARDAIAALAADPIFTMQGMETVISTAAPGMVGAWRTLRDALKKADSALTKATGLWPENSGSLIPAALTQQQYTRMGQLADQLNKQVSVADGLTLKTSLQAAQQVITCNSSMVDVALAVELRYYDETNTLISTRVEQTLTAGEGEGVSLVHTAAAELENEALASFESLGFDMSGYVRSIETNLSDTLTADPEAAYTVVYTPKDCAVRFAWDGSSLTVGYGWHLTLEAYPGTDRVYDYAIGAATWPQNSVYIVRGDVTVDRTAVKPATETDLLSVIAQCYGTDKETAILTSGALLGNEYFSIRYPDNDDGKLIVSEAGKLTVGTYNSGYNNRHWLPYSYTVGGHTGYFKGAGTVTVSAAGVDSIPVVYRLELTDISAAQVQQWLDDVKAMTVQAAEQRDALEKLNGQYNGMGQINKAVLNMLKNSIYDIELHEDWETNEALQDYMVEVLGSIVRDCVDTNGKLRIYNMLTDYRAENGGLVYYYRNSEDFIDEVALLGGYLSDMLGDELKIQALQIIMNEFGYPQYADRFTELEALMKEVSGNLMPPHKRIDVDSDNLDVLVQALTMGGTVGTTGALSPYLEETFQVAAPDKAVLQITVSTGSRVLGSLSFTYPLEDGYVLTQADVDGFRAQMQAIADAHLQTKYYTQTLDVDLQSLVGRVMDSNVIIKNVFTPITYTVHIQGMTSHSITVENPVVNLPAPATGFRNDYHIDGKLCPSGPYRFTADQLDRLFPDGSYTVAVTKVNVAAERLEAFLAELNEAGNGTMEFLLNAQKDTVTVNVAAGNQAALNACIQDVAMAMLGGYGYMGLDGRGLVYANEQGNTEISLQTIYDAVLHDDGFSHETLIGLQDGEGVLTVSTVQLGDSAEALEQDLTFVIYLTSVSEQLRSVGRVLEQKQGDLTFRANRGVLEVHINPREKMYQGLLSGMLLTGAVEQAELNAPAGGAAVAFMLDCLDQMVTDETVTMTTYENTLALLGWDTELTGDQLYYDYIAGILRNATVTEKTDGCEMLQTIDVRTPLDSAAGDTSAAPVLGTIKEYNTDGIRVDMYLTMELRDGYEALILDSRSGRGMYFTEDLASEQEGLHSGATVVLLKDLTMDLTLPEGAVLDLNGFDLTGNVTAEGAAAIVDSTADTFSCGSVSGELTGNITVWAGSFDADVTGMLADSLIQADGLVRDERYAVRRGSDGSLTYEIDFSKSFRADELAMALALDMLGGMSTAKLSFAGSDLYDLVHYALLTGGQRGADADLSKAILDHLQADGLGKLVSSVRESLSAYTAAAQGKPMGSYTLTVTPWELKITHIAQGDYLDLNLVTSHRAETLTVQTAAVDASGAQYLQELFPDTKAELNFTAAGADGLKATGKRIWNVDLTGRKEYAAILGVILGYGHKDLRPQVAAAINSADTQALKDIFNSLTVDQLLQALQALKPDVDFAAMAKAVGVSVDVSTAAQVEKAIHGRLCGMGQVLASATVTGGSAKLGSFESKAGDGSYTITGLKLSTDLLTTLGMTSVAAAEQTELTICLAGIHKAEAYDVIDAKGNVTHSGNNAEAALKALKNGHTLRVNSPSVVNFWTVKTGFHVENAHNITVGGFLLSAGVTVTADGPLQVYTAESGYTVKTTQTGNTYTYTLEAIQAPTCGKDLAKVWTAKLNTTVYLYVDADPAKGVTLDQLKMNLTFAQFDSLGGSVNYSISGYKDRIKTGDKLTITVTSGSLNLAKVEYTVIITGDVNRDGRVNAGDAVAMMKIYKGQASAYTAEQIMAADANRNGAAEKPRVDAGDAVRIMKKYMDWKTYLATESGK